MTTKTQIEWTEHTWNPTKGCTKISAGCKNCYAEVMARRLTAMGAAGYENGFAFSEMPSRLDQPRKRKKPTKFFVNSMSDLFHEDCSDAYIEQVLTVIRETPQHDYQLLTKRADRMRSFFASHTAPENLWVGVSVENKKDGLKRIDDLREIRAHIRFLSIEPLLEDLGAFDLTGIHWVIVGGESGRNARPMEKNWVENIKAQCEADNVSFFFKQWGQWGEDGVKRNKKINGKSLNGIEYKNYPEKKNGERRVYMGS